MTLYITSGEAYASRMEDDGRNSDSNTVRKVPSALLERQWKPGQSGNPSGRPKGTAGLARRVQDYIESMPADGKPTPVEVLAMIMHKDTAKDADRVAAAKELLNRAYGKAPIVVMDEGEDLKTAITDRHILEFLEKMPALPPSSPVIVSSSKEEISISGSPKDETDS